MTTGDLVLEALIRFERMTRIHRYGGQHDVWQLAKDALVTYQERTRGFDPRQMVLTLQKGLTDAD